jgi:hypothetical protein
VVEQLQPFEWSVDVIQENLSLGLGMGALAIITLSLLGFIIAKVIKIMMGRV